MNYNKECNMVDNLDVADIEQETIIEPLNNDNIEEAIHKIFADSLIFDTAENLDSKEKVSIPTGNVVFLASPLDLLNNPTQYIGKEVQLKQEIVTQSGNNPKRKSIYCYRIKNSDEGFEVDYSKSIEIFYEKLPEARKLVMLDFASGTTISVKGKVIKYSNSNDVYIQATEIIGVEKLLEEIREPESNLSRYVEFRQILAFPSIYENRPYAIRGELSILENHPESETLVLCESTGSGQEDFNSNNKIEISYKTCANHDRLLALTANHQKVKVRGYVGINEDKSTYMVGRVINITNSFIPRLSIKMLLAFPERYVGQIFKLEEQLVIYTNDVKRKSFKTWQSKGRNRNDYNTDNGIEVFYRSLPYVEKCIMIDADCQKIFVEGKVCKYNNSNDVYIEGTDISGDCIK